MNNKMTKSEITAINKRLIEAAESYYQKNTEIMTNREYDELYDMVLNYEKENGVIDNSITQMVGHVLMTELPKDEHEHKALSLNKTKSISELIKWLDDKKGCLSWKLDGLTIVATYDDGKLTKAVTRGDGIEGEIITHNAKFFKGLPSKITYKGHLVCRGEALITYPEFERINAEIANIDDKYENPRNLVSGTIRQLDSKKARERNVLFNAFELVTTSDGMPNNSFYETLEWLNGLGFITVEHYLVDKLNIEDKVNELCKLIEEKDFPSDGLVLMYDDIEYGISLGSTNKYPRSGKAFKWEDELKETTITDIKWQPSRTGLINPVVVYDPVRLEGTTISNATANNLSIMEEKGISIGSKILVYKANKIIPTIDRVVEKNGSLIIPDTCPVCGAKTIIKTSEKGIKTLNCPNNECLAKNVKAFVHFASRKAMNIKGLSDATIEKFIGAGFISTFADLFKLEDHKEEIMKLEGFGKKSFARLQSSIQKSRTVALSSFLIGLGIPNVGSDVSEKIAEKSNYDYNDLIELLNKKYDFTLIDGIGEIINKSLYDWYASLTDKTKRENFDELVSFMIFKKPNEKVISGTKLSGLKFVIHGTFSDFANKKEIQTFIEENGGTIVGSVSGATSYVLSDDINDQSSKTKKAKEMGIPIITGKDLKKLIK